MRNNFNPTPQNPKLRDHARTLRAQTTDAERKLWQALRGQQLGVRFRRQHVIEPFVLDFYCISLKLAVELDGGQHAAPDARHADSTRSVYLARQGIAVLRFWNNEVMTNLEGVLGQVVAAIDERLRGLPLP